MKPIHEQLYRFIRDFRRMHYGLIPQKIQIHINDFITLISAYHDEVSGCLQFDYRSPSIYEGTTFMGIPIKVSVHDRCIRITGVYEHEGEVHEDYELESVEG